MKLFDYANKRYCVLRTQIKNPSLSTSIFVVTRTRIVKASLDDLLRKYPIICPFRLRLWRTAERWTIEFDSLISTDIDTKKKAPVFLQVLCGDPDENRQGKP